MATKSINQSICQFFRHGFCRYKDNCRKQHVVEVCEHEHCQDPYCIKRHPRICRYYRDWNYCKFGSYCYYKHTSWKSGFDELNTQIANLLKVIDEMENSKKHMSAEISALELKIKRIENIENQTNKEVLLSNNFTQKLDVIENQMSQIKNSVDSLNSDADILDDNIITVAQRITRVENFLGLPHNPGG